MTYPQPKLPDSLPASIAIRRRSLEIVDWALCLAYIVLGALLAYVLAFGPARLHDSAGVQLVAGLGLHWDLIAATFALYSLLLTNRWTRVAGWMLGALLFGFYLISITHSIWLGHTGSALAIGAAAAALFSQMSGLARSMIAAEWRR